MPEDPNNNGRILQWQHLSTSQRKVVSDNLRQTGESMPERVSQDIDRLAESDAKFSARDLNTAKAVSKHVRPEPISLQRAANHRQRLYGDAQQRTPGQAPEGSDWYFEHHARVAKSADEFGFTPEHAHTASAVMSPQNSPENERAAVHAIMHAHSEGFVDVDSKVVRHLQRNGIDVSEHEGKTVHVNDLPRGSLSTLSDEGFRHNVRTNVDLEAVARGGAKEQNIDRAERVLLQEAPHGTEQMINRKGVVSGAKVASYDHVIRASKPGSADHVEFVGRVVQDSMVRNGDIDKDQQALDLYGHQERGVPDDHILSPLSHSVEDTWQNAVTFNQPKVLEGKTSVFKAGGSGRQYPVTGLKTRRDENNKIVEKASEDPRVESSMLLHAFNNRATQKAAAQQGVPPVAMQGAVWTEARRQAGKSREGEGAEANKTSMTNEQYREEVEVNARMGRQVPRARREAPEPAVKDPNAGQATLPGMEHLFNDRR